MSKKQTWRSVLTLSLLQQTLGPFGQLSNMGAIQVQKAIMMMMNWWVSHPKMMG
jgi:hypothetical protein